jgi:hypothetical protein
VDILKKAILKFSFLHIVWSHINIHKCPSVFAGNLAAKPVNLVIITPAKFSNELQPLVNHKNAHGVKTLLKTTEDIYAAYQGVDKPEQIIEESEDFNIDDPENDF